MKYFLDTEFLEGTQRRWFGRNTKPTIDLISIGIVAEDTYSGKIDTKGSIATVNRGREYYDISKDFNLKEAWNRYQWKKADYHLNGIDPCPMVKEYWIRENVLKPIWEELIAKEFKIDFLAELEYPFTYKGLKYLINKYGKSNKQIAEEIKEFVYNQSDEDKYNGTYKSKPEFYGYYADYDWVVFCWLFGKMIDLPNGFPQYCIDLKQELDRKLDLLETYQISKIVFPNGDKAFTNDNDGDLSIKLERIKTSPNYPKQTNEHNALDDARWNKRLYEFLNTI